MAKIKTPKHIMPTKPLSKLASHYTSIKSVMGWRDYDPGEKWAEAIAQALLDFAHQDTSMSFTEFFIWYGIIKRTYSRLRTKYEVIQEAHDMAKLIFGARRERMAIHKKYECDPKTLHQTLHFYHPDWRAAVDEERAFKASLSEKEKNQQPTKVTVVMRKYEDAEDRIRDTNTAG